MKNPKKISVLTLVQGRRLHLSNQLLGILRGNTWPQELVIIHMQEDCWPVADELVLPADLQHLDYRSSKVGSLRGTFIAGGKQLEIKQYRLDDEGAQLPLAKARNYAAAVSKGDYLIFLDVDCIPTPDYLEEMKAAIDETRGLVMSDIHYLAKGMNGANWDFQKFRASAIPHPRRPSLQEGDLQRSDKYYLFWSLSFGCLRRTFREIGGFDTKFVGYGGEDTDFALTARHAGVPFYLCGAISYHQYHTTIFPPLNHLEDIIENANIYKQKWGIWPMENWLRSFQKGGFVDWTENRLRLRRIPTDAEIRKHKREKLFT